MKNREIQKYSEYLFRAALKKCGNISDAEDLTQETLLAYLSCTKEIADTKAWLSSVLSRKFSDLLRKKYKLPTISIDLVPEESEPIDEVEPDDRPDEREIRRQVAYLAAKYREVIVRHYLEGERVEKIAGELGIPKGTVLSRLSVGREQMRKGFDSMKDYEKQSYRPERLDVSCHGIPGLADEPWSVVCDDLMKQNILIVAYPEPITVTEIAQALGIPTAYIESAVRDLVANELLREVGNRYCTDFLIVKPEMLERSLDVELEFTERCYPILIEFVNGYLAELSELEFTAELSEAKRAKLEYYFVLHLFSTAIYTAIRRIVPDDEEFPVRPNGGRWIAVGTHTPTNFDFESCRFGKYTYGGERRACFENTMNARSISLRVYDTQPELNRYEHGPIELGDDELATLLYIISRGIPIEATGFNPMLCEDIPHLTYCGVLGESNGRPFVNILMLTPDEYRALDQIRIARMKLLADLLEPGLREILPRLRFDIPKHLEGRIAKFRQYSCFAVTMAFIRMASERRDVGFTDFVPPMILVIDDNNQIR